MTLPDLYPVGLVLTGRDCLVVGGGAIAVRKVEGLVAAGARVTVIAPRLDPRLAALDPRPGALATVPRPYRRRDLRGRHLVIVATDDEALNRRVAAHAKRLGVWCNVADRPELCGFTLPAVHRDGPVTVAVATGGRSPALAGWLRDRIAGSLPSVAEAAEALAGERLAVRDRLGTTEDFDWTPSIERLLGSPATADRTPGPGEPRPMDGQPADATRSDRP